MTTSEAPARVRKIRHHTPPSAILITIWIGSIAWSAHAFFGSDASSEIFLLLTVLVLGIPFTIQLAMGHHCGECGQKTSQQAKSCLACSKPFATE